MFTRVLSILLIISLMCVMLVGSGLVAGFSKQGVTCGCIIQDYWGLSINNNNSSFSYYSYRFTLSSISQHQSKTISKAESNSYSFSFVISFKSIHILRSLPQRIGSILLLVWINSPFLCNRQYPFGYISGQNLQAYRNNRLLYLVDELFLKDSNLTVPLHHK